MPGTCFNLKVRPSAALLAFSLVLFAISASAQTYNQIYSFGALPDGSFPAGHMAFDSAGNLYGATVYGGAYSYGTIFELSPPASGSGSWTETTLYTFTGKSDGGDPYAGVTIDGRGNLYGAAYVGGSTCGCGTVFKMKPPTTQGGSWSFLALHQFAGGTTDGYGPLSPVTLDKAGNVYGTTYAGGTFDSTASFSGTAYKVSPSGSAWTESLIWSFGGPGDGSYTYSWLVFDSVGNIYGTTAFGGAGGQGTVFELSPPASGNTNWSESLLYSFPSATTAASVEPLSGLVIDAQDDLYGIATAFDESGEPCCGSVFLLKPPTTGTTWDFHPLYSFTSTTDGQYPKDLVRDPNTDMFYGLAIDNSDERGNGVIFGLTPGTPWTYSVTHDFNGTNASNPQNIPIIGPDGNLYGGAAYGGTNGGGAIFQIVP
jgi:uncharacterized repeat protein (TIGR03803 family)